MREPNLNVIIQQVMRINKEYGGKLNVKEWISHDNHRVLKCVLTWAVEAGDRVGQEEVKETKATA